MKVDTERVRTIAASVLHEIMSNGKGGVSTIRTMRPTEIADLIVEKIIKSELDKGLQK